MSLQVDYCMCQVLAHSVTDVTMWTKSQPFAGPYGSASRSSITDCTPSVRLCLSLLSSIPGSVCRVYAHNSILTRMRGIDVKFACITYSI